MNNGGFRVQMKGTNKTWYCDDVHKLGRGIAARGSLVHVRMTWANNKNCRDGVHLRSKIRAKEQQQYTRRQ